MAVACDRRQRRVFWGYPGCWLRGFGFLGQRFFFDPEYLSAASLAWETLDGQRGPWACLFTLPQWFGRALIAAIS